jgi:predicted metalloprotease with PDZ domain
MSFHSSGMAAGLRASLALLAGLFWAERTDSADAGAAPALRIEVDARELPRRLLQSQVRVPCRPGKLKLWFPKWVPGTHGPSNPVQNLGGMLLETSTGERLPWRRDELELYRIECDVPEGASEINVRLSVVCNEPAVDAAGYLSYGNTSVGIINWNTCLVYPEGFPCDDIQTHLTLRLPSTWHFATALKTQAKTGDVTSFHATSLSELIDCPLVAGRHLRTIALDVGANPPAFLDLVSESTSGLQLAPNVVDLYSRVVREAGALFGSCHYPDYHFLVTCSDDLGYFGLEHLTSSLNGVCERDLIEDARRKGWIANLLPHEYVHSWCGKFRRPAGMCTPDFHTPQKTRLLWVYEGLAEYLGEVLMARAGLVDLKEYRGTLSATIGMLSRHKGRRWRPLDDTAVASHLLRANSPNWNDLRRGQDYYHEGMLLWLEADAIIRESTGGKKSLDDFCRKFLGATRSSAKVVPYELPEIVETLHELADFDWERFLQRRVAETQDTLPLDVVGRLGYRLRYASLPPGGSPISRAREDIAALDSLGLSFSGDGTIQNVVPGMSGDRAGLAPGMKVIGVDHKTFSRQRLLDALAGSVARRKIELLLIEGEQIRTIVLDYADGPRYLELVRNESIPDLLAAIIKPSEPRSSTEPAADRRSDAVALPAPKGYVCYRAQTPLKIDGRLDDDGWKAAAWTDPFVDIEGDAQPLPRFKTRAKMLWDDLYFYVGAELEEPDVWGTLKKHDSVIFQDNDFEIFIDPDSDNHEYYEIEINALNTVWDLLLAKPYRDGDSVEHGPAINEWEIPGLKSAVHVKGTLNNSRDSDTSWSVEVAIPWKVLAEFAHRPAPPRDGDQWRINFSRVEWRHEIVDGRYRKVPNISEDNWVWSPQGAIDMHRPERWGYVQFSTAAPGRSVYKSNPDGVIRDRLMQIYHAQKAFFKEHKRWAASFRELNLPDGLRLPEHTSSIRLGPGGYEAAITFRPSGGERRTLTIRQDSRIHSFQANSPDSTSQKSPK